MQSEEVGEHWTLGAEDLAWLSGMPDAGKLGLAVQLMCWRRNGRFPDNEADPAPAVVRHLADQIGVGVEVLENYEWTGRTGRRHRRLPQPRALETQRYAMQQLLNGLLAGIMPAMYPALGALVSLFRRLAILAEKELLGQGEYGGMMNSLVLGGLTGAVIGLFSNVVPQGEQSAGLPLATTALALLAGYAADQVFAMFDSLAMRVFVSQAESGGKKSG